MNNGYEHTSQYQLFLCAYPHGKRVMPLACERVITCRVRAFTLFLEILWRVTNARLSELSDYIEVYVKREMTVLPVWIFVANVNSLIT